jgi:hypothetical protein
MSADVERSSGRTRTPRSLAAVADAYGRYMIRALPALRA